MTEVPEQYSSNLSQTNKIEAIPPDSSEYIRLLSALNKDRILQKLTASRSLHTHTHSMNKKLLASNSSSQVFFEDINSKKLTAVRLKEGKK